MKKNLSDMSLDELWQLFPMFSTEHQDHWNSWYNEEIKLLNGVLPKEHIIRISHIGSTAIKKIWGKPIVDILVVLSPIFNTHLFMLFHTAMTSRQNTHND